MRRTLILISVLLVGLSSGALMERPPPGTRLKSRLAHSHLGSGKPDKPSRTPWVVVPPGIMTRREAVERAFASKATPLRLRVNKVVARFSQYTLPTIVWEQPPPIDVEESPAFPAWRIDMFGLFKYGGCVKEWRIIVNARSGVVLESSTGGKSVPCPDTD